jgi:hypothetical protein
MKKYNYNLSTEEGNLPSLIDQKPFISVSVASDSQKMVNKINQTNDCGNTTETTNTAVKNLNGFFRFTAQNGASCGFISFPYIKQDFGNLLSHFKQVYGASIDGSELSALVKSVLS